MAFEKALNILRRLARAGPLPEGPLPDGDTAQVIGAEKAVVAIFDSNGRVFQVEGGTIKGGTFRLISRGRSETIALMEKLGTENIDWNDME